MSGKLAIMAGLAIVFGATSYYAGNQYLDRQAQARLDQIESSNRAIETTTVVVADAALSFGDTLDADKLRLISWPKDSMPEGAFTSIEDVIGGGQRRVLKAIARNEPLLAAKLSGEDGRASLSGIIAEGMRAVTIPVDTVKGVGGFVQPGDRVDIVFSQRDRQSGEQTAKIIMENVKVLTIDQQADTVASPQIAKTVTLETDTEGAQKLALASEVGRLSLLLRGLGDEKEVGNAVISLGAEEVGEGGRSVAPKPAVSSASASGTGEGKGGFLSFLNQAQEQKSKTVRVVGGYEVREATVPILEKLEQQRDSEVGE
ncbi:MAG: Flp pilus assembly protein CpaB [Nitratireductor sp.]|nr:Flp pilus assembly protein CpaB [Nitratireductor sp.]